MRITKTRAIVAVLLGLLAAGEARAQETLLSKTMRSRSRYMRFAVVDGRVWLKWTRLTSISMNYGSGSVKESLHVRKQNGRLHLTYERTAKDESLKVSVSGNGDVVSISRAPRGQSAIVPVEYRQDPREKITFSIGDGPRKQTFSADELWQLLIIRRKECEEHLLPLLKMLRPGWKIAETAADIEDKLLHGASEEIVKRRAHWAALVEQLGDQRFAKREAADRALRADGSAAIGYLRQLDFDRLDAEQRFRIRRILEAIGEEDKADSAKKVAERLAGDPAVWLALLARPEPESRKTAARQLILLLGRPIDVDPAADPNTQKQQRERLRARILSP